LHLIAIWFYRVRFQDWNINSPCWISFTFIFFSARTEVAILHILIVIPFISSSHILFYFEVFLQLSCSQIFAVMLCHCSLSGLSLSLTCSMPELILMVNRPHWLPLILYLVQCGNVFSFVIFQSNCHLHLAQCKNWGSSPKNWNCNAPYWCKPSILIAIHFYIYLVQICQN